MSEVSSNNIATKLVLFISDSMDVDMMLLIEQIRSFSILFDVPRNIFDVYKCTFKIES